MKILNGFFLAFRFSFISYDFLFFSKMLISCFKRSKLIVYFYNKYNIDWL